MVGGVGIYGGGGLGCRGVLGNASNGLGTKAEPAAAAVLCR